ncbi:MAG: prenyltransferase/squalene oxidase repeat-containing protein [Pirellulales bacterium]
MSARRKNEQPAQPERLARRDYRPSPRVALQISLGVHSLFVIMLLRMYSEYAGQPEPTLEIVARASAPRTAATPSFVAAPLSDVEVPEQTIRPVARVDSLPQQATSFAERTIAPTRHAMPGSRRATAPAALPSTNVIVPAEEITQPQTGAGSIAAIQPNASLERADTLPDMPLRIASRPIYGPRPQRPLGLALLPAARGELKQLQPADAFAQRRFSARTPPENQTAIDRGLEFLARMQLDDGRWQFRNLRGNIDPNAEPPSARADAAATGLALLAFFGAGHDHFESRYRLVIRDGLHFLVRSQQERGEFFPDDGLATGQLTRFYSHGIATLSLCEAFGMTGDAELRAPAQRAIDYLAGTQHPERGGWRYLPGLDADSSATGWQLATLRSGQLAGLSVRPETITQIRESLAKGRDKQSRQPSTVTTAVGLAVELHLGGSPGDQRLRPAADQLLAHPPEVGESTDAALAGTPENPQRDTYYWYYGSEAMYQFGGDDWQAWSRKLYPQLIQSQVRGGPLEGSWDPRNELPGKSPTSGGRIYLTAMNLLSLEIQNRHLPPPNSATVAPQIIDPPTAAE